MAYTPSISDIPSIAPATQSKTDATDPVVASTAPAQGGYTPSISDIPAVSSKTETTGAPAQQDTGIAGKAFAGATGFLNGTMDAIQGVGHLANNILKGGANTLYGKILGDKEAARTVTEGLDKLGELGNKALDAGREFTAPQSQFEQQAVNENIPIQAGAATLGNLGGLVAGGNALAKPVSAVTAPLADALPMIGKSPAAAGITNAATSNAIIGAAADQDNPLRGAVLGGLTGGVLQGATNIAGYQAQKASKIITEEIKNIKTAGIDPNSQTGVYNIQAALKEGGIHLKAVDIKREMEKQASDIMDTIRPAWYNPEDKPLNVLAKHAAENLPAAVARSKVLYGPINNSEVQIPTTTINQTLDKLPKKLTSQVTLPTPLPETATLNQMLSQRNKVDTSIAQAKSLRRAGSLSGDDIVPLFEARQSINNDIHANAAKLGLDKPLAAAEDHFNSVLRPFQVYNKNLDQLKQMTPDQMQGKVWRDLNRQFKSRFPDPNRIKEIAKTLGPDGRELVGWAKIENDLKNSDDAGIFNPASFSKSVEKAHDTGLSELIMTQKQQDVIKGIINLGAASKQVAPKGESPMSGITGKTLQHLIYSRPGIELLRAAGSKGATIQSIRDIAQQLFTGVGTLSQVQAPES